MSQQTILLLCGGGMILGLIAVVIDRLNFPQRKFQPKTVSIEHSERRASRDRTGAHIVDFDPKQPVEIDPINAVEIDPINAVEIDPINAVEIDPEPTADPPPPTG